MVKDDRTELLFNIYGEDKGSGYAGNVYGTDTISPTINTCGGGNRMPLILAESNMINVPQMVSVRKYPMDTDALVDLLRNHKEKSGYSNKEIAQRLGVPLTMAEHWFRKDEYSAIPDKEIWFDLKALLGIETTEFDDAVTVFEIKEGVFDKANRVWLADKVAPTLTSQAQGDKVALFEPSIVDVKTLGNYTPGGHNASKVVDAEYSAPTVRENHGTVTAIIDDLYKNRSERIYKDTSPNLRAGRSGLKVATPHVVGGVGEKKSNNGTQYYLQDRIYDGEIATTTTTYEQFQPNYQVEEKGQLRIRKLTPRECFRLMGVKDAETDKLGNLANSTLYHLAGDSIVTTVLMAIFGELLEVEWKGKVNNLHG